MSATRRAYLELHIAVFLYGLTAILGAKITLDATLLVWWRMLLAAVSLFVLLGLGKTLRLLPRSLIVKYMGIGVILAIHWIAFFGCIKLANASVALVCFATASFFTAFLEPLLLKQPFKWYEIALGCLVIPGMYLVVQGTTAAMLTGIVIGMIAAVLYAVVSVLNKKLIRKTNPTNITFLELGSGCLFITFLLPFYFQELEDVSFLPSGIDWLYLLILALLCTTLAYLLNLRAMQHLPAFTVTLSGNLEPIYGILLAILILEENQELTASFYWGAFFILAAVFSYPFVGRK